MGEYAMPAGAARDASCFPNAWADGACVHHHVDGLGGGGDCFLNSLPALKNAKNCVAKPQLP
jgi:hypothetical protein